MEDVKPAAPVEQSDVASSNADQSSNDNLKTESVSSPEIKRTQDKVAYETYKKLLSEKKNTSEKLSSVQAELEKLREEKMQAEGKKDELLEDYRKKYQDTKELLTKKEQQIAWSRISSAIESEAMKHGCINTNKFIQLLSDKELSSLEVDENYNVDTRALAKLVEEGKKENDFLFKRSVGIADGQPGLQSPVAKPKTMRSALEDYVKNLK